MKVCLVSCSAFFQIILIKEKGEEEEEEEEEENENDIDLPNQSWQLRRNQETYIP